MLTEKEQDDLFYVCCLLEYTSRKTKNYISTIVKNVGKEELERQLEIADTSHCLSWGQVSDELIEECNIECGAYEREGSEIKFKEMGRHYQQEILQNIKENHEVAEAIINYFCA